MFRLQHSKEQTLHGLARQLLLLKLEFQHTNDTVQRFSIDALNFDCVSGASCALLTLDCVFRSLSTLTLGFNINLFQLSLQFGNLLHVALRKILKSSAIFQRNRKFLTLFRMLALKFIQRGFRTLKLRIRAVVLKL